METSDSHSEPVKLISEIIPIKSLSVSQSVFQKKPEFKERYCELLYDEETEQKTLDIYKIKSQKKKVLFISHQILSSTKFMMDDTDGRFQLVLDSLPTIIFLFPSHNMRNRWIKAINLKPSIEELSKGSKEIEQEPSVKVDANNPVQIDTSVHNLSRANSSSATELQPIIKAFRSSSSESLLKVNTIEEKLKAQKLEDIEKNSPVTEVKQEDSSYGPSGRALSLQNQIGEISSRPRRPSRKESSAVDSVSLVLQPPGTLKLYSAPEEKTEDEPKAKPDALQSSLQPLNSLTKPELHPFSMHENDVPAPAVIVQKTTTDSSFSKDEIVVKRASSLKNVRSPNDNTNKQGSPRSTYDYQPTNTSIRSPLQMSELVSSDKPISAFNRHKPDSSPSSGQKHSNPSNLNLLKSEIEALSAMNDELNAALERSEQLRQEEVTASFNEISRLRLVLEEAMIQKTHLEEENATVITLEEQLRQLKEKNELMTIAYESLNKEYEKLQHGYKSSVEIQQQLLKEKTEIVEFNKQQKEASENLQNEIYISQNKQQELIIQLVSLTKQNESLLEENQNLHNLFQQQTRTIESLESSANQLQLVQTSNYDLNELINYQKEQIHLLQSEVANKKLDSEARTRTEESNKLTIQRLEHLINEQQQFIQDISNQLSSYKQYKQLYDESQLETIQAKDDLQKALLEKKQLQQEIDRLLIQVQYHEHEKKQKVIQYDELYANKQKDQHQLKEQLHTLQMEYDHLQNENTILQRRIELQKEQQAKFKNDEEINQRRYLLELQSLQTQITTYKESIEHANHNAYDLQKKLQGSEEEKLNIIHDLQVRLNQAEDVQSIQKKTIHDMNQRMHQLDTTIQSQQEQILKEKQMYHILQEESLLKEESWKSEKLSFLQDLQIQKDSLEDLKLRLSLKEKELFGSEHQRRESQDTLAKLLEDQRIQTHQIQQLYQELKEDYTKLVHETKNEKHVLEDRISSLNTIQHNLEIKLQELESHSTSTITEKNINIQLLSKQLNEFEIQTIEQTTKINELIAQLKSYELQTIEERKKNESLTRLFSDLQDQYTSSIKEKDLAQQNLFILEEAKVQQEKKSCREIELLQQQLQHRSKELQETQELLQEKEVLYSTRIQSLEETILSHVQIVKEKTSNLQSLEMNIKEKHLEIQQAQSAIRQTEKQAQELAEQHHQLSLSIIEKDKVLQEKERQIQELKSLFQQKVEKLNIYESQILPDHQQILQERQSDIERLNLQIEALKHDNHQLNQSNQLAEQQILSLNQSIHTLEQDLILQNQQIEKSKLFTEELQRQLTNSLKSIKTLEETNRDEIQHWNRHIQEIEQKFLSDKENDRKEIQQLNNDLRAKDMNIITLKQENNHLTNKLQNTEELLQIAQEKINDMVLKDIMNKEMDKLHKENHDVTAQLLQTKDLLQKKELQYTNLEQRFSHQKQEIVEKLLQLCEDFELFPSTDATKGNEESFLPKVFESLLEEKQEFQNFFKDLKTIFPPSSNSPSFLDNGNGRRKSVKVLVEEVENKKTGNEKENDKQIIPDIRTYIKQIIEEASERSNLQQQFIQQSFQQYPGSINGRSGKNKASVDQAVENLRSSLSKIHHSIHQHLQDSQYNYKQLLEEYKSLSEQFHSLNSTIEQQESQLKRNSEVIQTLKDQKQLSEERHQQEIELLQKDLNQSFADYESLQEDHQKYIVLLNNNWEEKLQQQLSNVRYQADEKYLLLEKKREEDIKDKDQHLIITKENYLKQITVLQNNYEEVKHQDQQHQKLLQKLSIENTSFQEENEALLNELQLKDSQLNEVTNQLQLLEYQMAKENREKLLIERNFRKTLMMKEKQPYAPSATSAQPAFSNVREDRPSVPSVIPVVKSHHPVSHYRYRDQSPPTSPTPPPNPITNEPSLSRASSFYDRGVPFRSTDVEERTPENNQKSSKDLMKGLIERLSPKATLEDELRTSRAERASISPKRERMYPKKVEGLRIIKDRILDQDPDSRPSSSPPNRRSRRVEPDSGKLSDRQVIQTSRMKNQLRSELAYMKDGKQSLGEDKTTTNSRNEVRQGKFRTTSKPLENNHNQDESEEDDDDLMEVRSFSSHGGKDTFFAITEANNHHQTKDFPQHREISKDAEKEESEEEESSDDDYLPETKKSLPLKKEINNTNNLEKSKNNAYALRAQLQTNKSSVGRERDSEEDDEETYEDDFHSTNRASSRQPASQYRSKPSNCSLLSTALREKERGFAENEDDDDDGEYMKGKPKSTKALATSMNQRLTLKDLL